MASPGASVCSCASHSVWFMTAQSVIWCKGGAGASLARKDYLGLAGSMSPLGQTRRLAPCSALSPLFLFYRTDWRQHRAEPLRVASGLLRRSAGVIVQNEIDLNLNERLRDHAFAIEYVAAARALTRKLDEISRTCARPRPRYALGRSACRGCMAATRCGPICLGV